MFNTIHNMHCVMILATTLVTKMGRSGFPLLLQYPTRIIPSRMNVRRRVLINSL
jgi:hypothetical protein